MAIALPLLVQIFEPIQMAVQWLSGASSAPGSHRPQPQRSLSFIDSAREAHDCGRGIPLGTSTQPSATRSLAQPAWHAHSLADSRAGARGASRTGHAGSRLAGADRPLRVVRVVDQRLSCAGAGRMVISGRMADVCAELDRLAELETRH